MVIGGTSVPNFSAVSLFRLFLLVTFLSNFKKSISKSHWITLLHYLMGALFFYLSQLTYRSTIHLEMNFCTILGGSQVLFDHSVLALFTYRCQIGSAPLIKLTKHEFILMFPILMHEHMDHSNILPCLSANPNSNSKKFDSLYHSFS